MLPLLAALLLGAPPAPSRWMLGLRLGFGWPFGEVGGEVALRDPLWGQVPFELELGIRPSPSFTLAAFGAYGAPLFQPVAHNRNWGQVVRFGVEALFEPDRRGSISPWFGLAAGGEWIEYRHGDVDPGGIPLVVAIDGLGWVPVDLQAGFTWYTTQSFGVGPFVELAAGRFSHVRLYQLGFTDSLRPAWHQWLIAGIAARF
jgi:hypothetical protein